MIKLLDTSNEYCKIAIQDDKKYIIKAFYEKIQYTK